MAARLQQLLPPQFPRRPTAGDRKLESSQGLTLALLAADDGAALSMLESMTRKLECPSKQAPLDVRA